MNTIKNCTTVHLRLSGCVESFNILNNLSNKVCVLNKTEDLNIHVFKMIAGKNE